MGYFYFCKYKRFKRAIMKSYIYSVLNAEMSMSVASIKLIIATRIGKELA